MILLTFSYKEFIMFEEEMSNIMKISDKMKLVGTDKQKILIYKEFERIFKSHKDRYVSKEIERKAEILWQYLEDLIVHDTIQAPSCYVEDIRQHLKWIAHHDNKLIFQLYKMATEEQVNKILREVETTELEPNTQLGGYWTFYKSPEECNGVTNVVDYAPILKPGDKYYQGYRFYMFKLCFLGAIKQFIINFEKNTSIMESEVNSMQIMRSGIFENAKIISKPKEEIKNEAKEENHVVIAPIVKEEAPKVIEEIKEEKEVSEISINNDEIDRTIRLLTQIKDYENTWKTKIREVTEKYNEAQELVKHFDEENIKLRKFIPENTKLKETIKIKDDKIFDLEFNRNELMKKITTYDSLKSYFENNFEKIKKYDQLVSDNQKLNESVQGMESQISSLVTENKTYREKAEYYDIVMHEYEDKTKTINELNEQLKAMSQNVYELTHTNQEMKLQIEDMEKIEKKAESYETLVEEKKKLEQTHERLIGELKDLRLYKKNNVDVLKGYNDEIASLKKEVKDRKKEMDLYRPKYDSLIDEFNKVTSRYQSKCSELEIVKQQLREAKETIVVIPTDKYTIDRTRLPGYLNGDVFIRGCLNCLMTHSDEITCDFDKVWFQTALHKQVFKTDMYTMKKYWDFLSMTGIIKDLPNTSGHFKLCQFDKNYWEPAMMLLKDRHQVCGIAAD